MRTLLRLERIGKEFPNVQFAAIHLSLQILRHVGKTFDLVNPLLGRSTTLRNILCFP
jgi:hypothetical protein